MKARKHRGLFSESMETMQEIEPTKEAVCKYFGIIPSNLSIEASGKINNRKGWEAETVYVMNNGACVGMISEKLAIIKEITE